MTDAMILFSLGENVHLTVYGLCLGVTALLFLLLSLLLASKRGVDSMVVLDAALWGLPLAVIGARLMYCLAMATSLVDFGGISFFLRPWLGGYTISGAFLGLMAALLICSKRHAVSFLQLADVAAPGAALMMTLGRLAEVFTNQGLGEYIEDEALQVWPIAVKNTYEMWQMPVFFYEAVLALLVLIVCMVVFKKGVAGRTFEWFLLLSGLTSIIMESMREDEFIRFGFVRLNMIMGCAAAVAVLAVSLHRCVKQAGWTKWQITRLVLFVLFAVLVVLAEFALDKSTMDNRLVYALMALFLAGMGVAALMEGPGGFRQNGLQKGQVL